MAKKGKNQSPRAAAGRAPPEIKEDVEATDDEEISEDEAFNSDDEKKYGTFFAERDRKQNADDSSDDESGSDDSSDEEEEEGGDDEGGDGGAYMLSLLENLDKPKDSQSAATTDHRTLNHLPESEFSSSALPGKSASLTISSLLSPLSTTQGFGNVQKIMQKMIPSGPGDKVTTTTLAPLSKPVENRMSRKIHYEDTTEEISGWTEAVKQNADAETLDFRPKDKIVLKKEDLIDKFSPETEFEKEIAAALEESTEQQRQARNGEDDLGEAVETLEGFMKRKGDLIKMRHLMFYEEMKRHQINKIKSKKYRKIRRKQREKMAGGVGEEDMDLELEGELKEKEMLDRMKERMSLAHRNTSKWAKRQLKRGKGLDTETRRALSENVKKGEDLRKKMVGEEDGDTSDEDVTTSDLVLRAKGILDETDQNDGGEEGIFKMKFMKRGLAQQREKAKQEAMMLLEELQANQTDEESDSDGDGDQEEEKEQKALPPTTAGAQQTKVLPKGKLLASRQSNSLKVTGEISIDLPSTKDSSSDDESDDPNVPEIATHSTSDYSTTISLTSKTPPPSAKENQTDHQPIAKQDQKNQQPQSDNPWVKSQQAKSKKSNKNFNSNNEVVNAQKAASQLVQGDDKKRNSLTANSKLDKNTSVTELSQEELVKKAFAAPSEKEIMAEFQTEKDEVHDEENTKNKKKSKSTEIPKGWGNWCGEGVAPPKKPKRLPKHLLPVQKAAKKPKLMDSNKKGVIIPQSSRPKVHKYMVQSIPYPHKSKQEYEKAMLGTIGKEWNVTQAVKNMTKKDVLTTAGKIIKPIGTNMKRKRVQARGPAKF